MTATGQSNGPGCVGVREGRRCTQRHLLGARVREYRTAYRFHQEPFLEREGTSIQGRKHTIVAEQNREHFLQLPQNVEHDRLANDDLCQRVPL